MVKRFSEEEFRKKVIEIAPRDIQIVSDYIDRWSNNEAPKETLMKEYPKVAEKIAFLPGGFEITIPMTLTDKETLKFFADTTDFLERQGQSYSCKEQDIVTGLGGFLASCAMARKLITLEEFRRQTDLSHLLVEARIQKTVPSLIPLRDKVRQLFEPTSE